MFNFILHPYSFSPLLGACLLLFLFACQPDSDTQHAPSHYPTPTQEEMLLGQASLDSLPLRSGADLAQVLPAVFEPYQSKSSEETAFSGQKMGFAQAGAVYHMSDQYYLAIDLADYAHDPQAYQHLFEQHQQVQSALPPSIKGRQFPSPYPDSFFWAWEDGQTGVHYLEAGLFHRYHLRLSTDRPMGTVVLESALKEVKVSLLQR